MHRDLRTGEDREITSERFLALSPGARVLAFQTGEISYDLIEVPLDGTPPTPVLATDRDEVAPSWAPDGIHFAYATNRAGPALRVKLALGLDVVRIGGLFVGHLTGELAWRVTMMYPPFCKVFTSVSPDNG